LKLAQCTIEQHRQAGQKSLALAQLVKSIPTTTGKVDFFNIRTPNLELFFVLPENELFFT
jgi:hypothetical protein